MKERGAKEGDREKQERAQQIKVGEYAGSEAEVML